MLRNLIKGVIILFSSQLDCPIPRPVSYIRYEDGKAQTAQTRWNERNNSIITTASHRAHLVTVMLLLVAKGFVALYFLTRLQSFLRAKVVGRASSYANLTVY